MHVTVHATPSRGASEPLGDRYSPFVLDFVHFLSHLVCLHAASFIELLVALIFRENPF